MSDEGLAPRPTAVVIDGCSGAPSVPICGVPRRVRLEKTLARMGYTLVPQGQPASRTIPDCHVLIGDQELHLCEEGLPKVEHLLLRSLIKPIDGMVARRFNRPISLAITRRLMNTPIKPNHVSAFNLVLGLSCGPLMLLAAATVGSYWAVVLGAVLNHTQSVLDGVDGELSRLRFQGSKLGQWLDTLSDDLTNVSFFAGAVALAPWEWLQIVGAVGLGAYVLTEAIIYYALATRYHSGDLLVFRWDIGGGQGRFSWLTKVVKRDFFGLFCVGLALAHALPAIVILQTIGALSVFGLLIRQTWRRGLSA